MAQVINGTHPYLTFDNGVTKVTKGEAQNTNGIIATDNLNVSITDKLNQAVSRSTPLDFCQAPYKMELISTAGGLTTQYGFPRSSFSGIPPLIISVVKLHLKSVTQGRIWIASTAT